MVFELQFQHRSRAKNLAAIIAIALTAALGGGPAYAQSGDELLGSAQKLFAEGQYFKAARYAFAAQEANPSLAGDAYSWVTLGLVRAGLPQASSYFFIRTLQNGNPTAVRRVLTETETLMTRVGPDLLRQYLVRHTKYEDYNLSNRSAYLYALGKDALLAGDSERAVGYLNGIDPRSPLRAYGVQLRGSAYAIAGKDDAALKDFRACADNADAIVEAAGRDPGRVARARRESNDLEARCQAGEARTLYQMGQFAEADRAYDQISKSSLVWPDILFEQAWNSFGKQEYNRTLGKLVSYKSPALSFVFNTETDVLRAQSFLALCLYSDANDVINEFNGKYTKIGEEVKQYVEHTGSLESFFDRGKSAAKDSLYTKNGFNRMANRFVRTPYFQGLVSAEQDVGSERNAVRRFDAMQPGVEHAPDKGFPGFLNQVLAWRLKTVRMLGGAFVKNSLIDYHTALISDFEKMAFIKLEMLKRAKEKLLFKRAATGERDWGNVEPSRRDDQYFWTFNGEFWNDELGDYVFGLESECKAGDGE